MENDAALAARDADLALIAVPVAQTEPVLRRLGEVSNPNLVITDAGSTKGDFVQAARRVFCKAKLGNIVPGHPIAGAELTGVDAASPTLFEGRRVVLTPLPESRATAVARVEAMWSTCGARVARMDPARHDEVFSAVSHLPHVLAFALVEMIAARRDGEELFSYAAGGFRDFTRIAGSSPEMWRDICVSNREPLLADIESFRRALLQISDLVRAGDGARLQALFDSARSARERWIGPKS